MKKFLIAFALLLLPTLSFAGGYNTFVTKYSQTLAFGLGEKWTYTDHMHFIRNDDMVAWVKVQLPPTRGFRLAGELERACIQAPNAQVRLGVEFGF